MRSTSRAVATLLLICLLAVAAGCLSGVGGSDGGQDQMDVYVDNAGDPERTIHLRIENTQNSTTVVNESLTVAADGERNVTTLDSETPYNFSVRVVDGPNKTFGYNPGTGATRISIDVRDGYIDVTPLTP